MIKSTNSRIVELYIYSEIGESCTLSHQNKKAFLFLFIFYLFFAVVLYSRYVYIRKIEPSRCNSSQLPHTMGRGALIFGGIKK